jgi:hypothetical protein
VCLVDDDGTQLSEPGSLKQWPPQSTARSFWGCEAKTLHSLAHASRD